MARAHGKTKTPPRDSDLERLGFPSEAVLLDSLDKVNSDTVDCKQRLCLQQLESQLRWAMTVGNLSNVGAHRGGRPGRSIEVRARGRLPASVLEGWRLRTLASLGCGHAFPLQDQMGLNREIHEAGHSLLLHRQHFENHRVNPSIDVHFAFR